MSRRQLNQLKNAAQVSGIDMHYILKQAWNQVESVWDISRQKTWQSNFLHSITRERTWKW